jgi:Spy/CpxP family protein refolding chaperone
MTQCWGRYAFVLLFSGICLLGFAADKKSSSRKTSKSAAAKQEMSGGRLPRYFAGLVDDEQREEIYQIQLKYREQIQELEKELAELEQEQLGAMEKVLTTTQRKELAALRSAASKKQGSTSRTKKN